LLPLSRVLPPLYAFRVRSRVFRWYAQLREIENRLTQAPGAAPELLEALDALERRVASISLPLSYTDQLYALRNHIDMVRQQLRRG
jgi:hypothetical protein